jgi:hypothetical protein
LARTPQNNEAFFREVDDEVRREQLTTAARRYGVIVAVVVVLALVALGGALWWRSHRDAVAGERGDQLIAAMASINAANDTDANKQLQALVATGDKAYAPLARLLQADVLVKNGKLPEATAAFMVVANDGTAPQQLRDAALLRATTLDFDKVTPQTVIARLKPLAVPGNPWFGSAGEMTGIAYMKLNQPKQAGAQFVAITKDPTVPRSLRARVAQLAADLGFDPVQPADSPAS